MRTHRADLVSFVVGIVFLLMGLRFLPADVQVWDIDWSWLWPVALLLGGVVVLASARSRDDEPRPDLAFTDADLDLDDPDLQDQTGPVAP